MLGANWFFRTLFVSSILFMFLNLLINSLIRNQSLVRILRALICFTLTIIGGLLGQQLSLGKYFNILTVMTLLDMGLQVKELALLNYIDTRIKKIVSLLVCFIILLVLNQYGEISINRNIITNPFYFLICSSAGFVIVYLIADFISKTELNDCFIYLGRESLWVMYFHYIGFMIVIFTQILILNEPITNLSAYPTHHTVYAMWMIYGLAGILIPIMMVKKGTKIRNVVIKQ